MCTKKDLQAILKAVATCYKQVYGKDLCKLYLYGSYARGEENESSDVDIVAIVSGNRAELQERLKSVWEMSSDLELDYETIISPTVIPLDEFEKYKKDLPYYSNIVKEGVEISA